MKGILAALNLSALILIAACSPKADVNPQTPSVTANNVKLTPEQRRNVHLYKVAPSTFHKTVETTGVVDFDNDHATSVLAPFSGPVSRLLVSLGDHVKLGAPLAVVNSPDFATAISAYRKAIAAAQTARRLADLDKELVEHNGVSKREADQAESDALGAEADREAALQSLVSLHVPADAVKAIQDGRSVSHLDGVIRAPVAGTVVEKLITPGQLLQAGTTACFTVADLSRVWILAQVFGADLTAVHVGDSADVITGIGDNTFSGTVDNIAALVDPDTRSVAVRVVAKNPSDFLKKQMYVRVVIHAQKPSTGTLIPVSAVLRDDVNLPFVYAVQSDGSFARQHVTLAYRTGDQYDIADGLKDGDEIVVDGGLFVQFMQNQ
ncbi:MAG TPA: efflux RND transporter periplasmic adaptor subunit [Steroidobacteraceae bacterium]|nr:efflux RND transporter periplasmic adaptor subunit [Steroidobacteraceae bacterium]